MTQRPTDLTARGALPGPPTPGGLRLVARHVRHAFRGVVALDDVTLEVAEGSAVALVGESGAGKSTLLRCFNGMVRPDDGGIVVGDVALTPARIIPLRRTLGYVQQQGGLIPHWTAARNVGLVLRALGVAPEEEARAVSASFALVGLDQGALGGRYPRELSGGQRQRVALARAIAARPGALLLDEPFGALDAITRTDVQEAFARLRAELRVTVLLVTHDLAEAARLADRIVVLRAGRVEQAGTMAALRSTPATEYVAALVGRALAQATALSAT